jgi:predicted RNA-binding protein
MCLSTAYFDTDGTHKDSPEQIVMEYVANVNIDGENVTLTDMMGVKKTVRGMLTFADLTGGLLRIREIK